MSLDTTKAAQLANKAERGDLRALAALLRDLSTNIAGPDLDLGSSGIAGSLDVFPTTASKGKLRVVAAASAGDTITTLTNASQAAARTYTLPDAGADGKVVLGGGNLAATCSSNAATCSRLSGIITSESLVTAAGSSQALTITNTFVAATDIVIVTQQGGTSTTGSVEVKAVPGAGSFVITLTNRHASAAFNGTFILGFQVIKA